MKLLLPALDRSAVAISLVLVLCAIIIFCFDPGHLDGDALGMLSWVKAGTFADWYPLLVPLLLKMFVALRIGPVGILAIQVLGIGLCTYAILAFFWRPFIAAVCTYLVLLTPSVLGYLGAVTSHGVLTAFALCGFTGLLYLTRAPTFRRPHLIALATLAGFSLAVIARQNGVVFALPGFVAWAVLLTKRIKFFKIHRVVHVIAALTVGCAVVVISSVSGNALLKLVLHPVHNEPIETMFLYDLSAISLRSHHLYIDSKHFPNHNLTDLRKIFRKNFPDLLTFYGYDNVPPLRIYHDPADRQALMRTWIRCIEQHPAYYITERYQMFRGLLGLDFRVPPAVPFHPGIDGNKLGYYLIHPAADKTVVEYLEEFSESIIDRPFIYLLLLLGAIGLLPFMLPKSPDVRLILLSLSAGSFLNVAGYFFVSPSTLLRYLWPSIVTSMVVMAVVFPYALQLVIKQTGWFRESQRALAEISNWGKFKGLAAVETSDPADHLLKRLRSCLAPAHRRFGNLAEKWSTTKFLKLDAWAIWFYAVCLGGSLIASVLNFNGSSISIYHSLYSRGAAETPIFGRPNWIRMDEWDFQTPAILNQADAPHRLRVENTPLGSHSVALVGNIPVAHFSALFRPQFWSFFVLPVEHAYAFHWQFKALILVTGVFTWLLLLTRSTLWAATGSLWYFFSPFTQWSYSWPSLLPEMTGSICFAMVFACYLAVGKSRLSLNLAALGFATCAINFGLCAYVPHILPFLWLAGLFFIGWIVANWNVIRIKGKFGRNRLVAASGAIALVILVTTITSFQAWTAIQGIANTVYPGKRLYAGGTMNIRYFLAQFFDWFTSETHYPAVGQNICEVVGFLWLAPVALFCFDYSNLSRCKRISLTMLTCCAVLLFGWMVIPLPHWFGSLLALDRTGETRPLPALGLANVALVALLMSSFSGNSKPHISARRSTGVLLVVSLVLFLTDQSLGWFYPWKQLLAAIVFTTLLINLIMSGSRRLLPILLVVPCAFAFGTTNPLERGLGVITSSAMYRFVRGNPDYLKSKWLVFSDSLWMPGFLTASGCKVYDGWHYLPDIDHFPLFASRGLDVNAFNQDGYLLTHAIGSNEKTSVQAVGPGWTRWNVNPNDPLLKELGIKYVAFDQKPLDNILAGLVPVSARPVDNFWLYRIP